MGVGFFCLLKSRLVVPKGKGDLSLGLHPFAFVRKCYL